MAYVNRIAALGTVPVLDIYRIITEITGAKGGIFLRQSIQRIGSVAACRIGISGKTAVCIVQQAP